MDDLATGADHHMTLEIQSEPDLHCSVQTRQIGEQTAGSATAADHFLLVELPLPWPSKIESHPIVAALPAPPAGEKLRVLAIRGAGDDQPDGTRQGSYHVISYRHTAGMPFDGFVGGQAVVSSDHLADTLAAIVGGSDEHLQPIADTTDVLLCTHGSRDRCCGQFGTLLYAEMALEDRPNTRFWRTSHTGGHRFAPTGITFPDGLTWSFLDAPTLGSILDRSVEPSDLVEHFRGCAGVGSRPAQIADAALFERSGWAWLERPRDATVRTSGDGNHEVLLSAGDERVIVTLSEGEPLPVPVCTEPLEASMKSTPQLIVSGIATH